MRKCCNARLDPVAAVQQHRIMKILAPIHRKAVNQAPHAAAKRFEIETRDKWIRELTQTLEGGASFQKMQARIAKLAS